MPGTSEDPPMHLSRDGRPVFLDEHVEPLYLVLVSVFLRCFDAFQFEPIRLDTLFQPLNLVDRQAVMTNKEVSHGDIEISLTLCSQGVTSGKGFGSYRAPNLQGFESRVKQGSCLHAASAHHGQGY
jgi:hypothetical protein